MSIYEILQAIQSELKAPKTQYNKFGGYNYRNCEDILEAVKPICAKYKAVVILTDELVIIGERYYIKATAVLKSGENEISTTAYAREEESKKGMDGSQVTGAASSYARKYALNGLFAIDDTKDSDTTNTGTEGEKKTVKKASENNIANTTLHYPEVLNYVLKSGKYPGKTLKEVYKTDRSYINELLMSAETDDYLKKAITIINAAIAQKKVKTEVPA